MFVSDKVVFIELHKTGCTHIRNLLAELVGGEFVGKHNQVDASLLAQDNVILGSVRDPWDWYVSLWAYGCDRKGLIFGNVTRGGMRLKGHGWKTDPYGAFRELLASKPNRNAGKWRRTYRDVNDAGAFRDWLHMLHDEQCWSDLGEGYGRTRVSRVAGLYTYRYARLFSCLKDQSGRLDAITTFEELAEHDRQNCFVNYFIRNESLEADLFFALEAAGFVIAEGLRSGITDRARTNTSSRRFGVGSYYDSATRNLVADRDRLIVERFHYAPPLHIEAGCDAAAFHVAAAAG